MSGDGVEEESVYNIYIIIIIIMLGGSRRTPLFRSGFCSGRGAVKDYIFIYIFIIIIIVGHQGGSAMPRFTTGDDDDGAGDDGFDDDVVGDGNYCG